MVLIGTLYPIFLEVISNEKISVGAPFYHKLMVPFLIPFFIFMSIGPRLKWIKDKFTKINYYQILILILSLVISYLIVEYSGVKYLFSTILISTSIFLFYSSASDLVKKNIQVPQKISHFAFSLLIISILVNGIYSKEINSNMKVGDNLTFMNKKIEFKSINFEKQDNLSLIHI